ncbi:MAG TPA: primosomal protein N' [Candidatus Acidoferrales bacterium]|nr:primosomal protein N' [Candidatus Acidoferrales bacterium]
MTPRYCEIALPVPLRSTFTYAIPQHLNASELVGSRVVVPFRNRAMVGVVVALAANPPEGKKTKEIVELLDAVPALPPKLIELGEWVSRYYVAPIGETLRAMLPPLAELRQEREYELTDHGREFLKEMKERGPADAGESVDLAILELLRADDKPAPSARLRRIAGGETVAERLVRRGCIVARERMRRQRERAQKIVAWNPVATASDAKEEKVREILTATRGPLPVPILLKAGASRAVAARLEKEGKLTSWQEPLVAHADAESAEDAWETDFVPPANVLNADQKSALAAVSEWLAQKAFVTGLLHGVTGSGKTEIYLGAVEATLAQSRNAIVLVPEIALTLWLSRLVRARFGGIVAVLHSGLADNERSREWWRVRRGEARVVVGTRSAVFAPLENVGLIIVDEEQESSYKQEETPRYNGRDVAIVRARLEGAVALLGSATPSLESFQNARTGKYRLLELTTRVEARPLASVKLVDLRQEFKQAHRSAPVSSSLLKAVGERFAAGTQVLILINRRGYSWYVLCRSCGAGIECQNCSIALSYHKRRARLECHYCGYSITVPKLCPKCKSEYLYFVGDGAERVEEYFREQFPKARIARLDRDTVRTKREYQKVLGAFARGDLDLLVGTQMVAKGHDFERVTLVGVVSADLALGRPDFRAAERTFQLLTQVAGRAGRGRFPGEVLIETYYPEHYAIQHAVDQDYSAFFDREIHFRRMMHYPPFIALANVLVRDRKIENAIRWSRAIAAHFDALKISELKVLGPAAAALSKLRREYRFQILLKTPNRRLLAQVLDGCLSYCEKKGIPDSAIIVDVDPTSLL